MVQSGDPNASGGTIVERISSVAKASLESQFYWWLGHVTMLTCGLIYYVKRPFGSQGANWYYPKALLGALVSYAIVVYKTYGPPQANLAFAHRLIVDENVEYLLLALYWYSSRPIFVTLVPFVVFSLFHVLTYARSVLIPTVFPNITQEIERARRAEQQQATMPAISMPARVSKFLGDWSTKYYSPALREVGVWEVAVICVWVSVGALTFQTPFVAPLVYLQFLRMRYALSAPTRAAFRRVRAWLDRTLTPPMASANVPGVVTDSYIRVRDILVKMGDTIMDPNARQQQQQQQPPRN
ncbi:Transmembrane nucleoporin [Coemansia sp. IMI 209127]|nr:Transmembrane nucleoporin [Coemansia sp. IMI 209127]